MNKKGKKWIIGISTALVLAGAGLYCGVNYLYQFAIARNEKDFMNSSEASGSAGQAVLPYEKWTFLKETPRYETQKTSDGLTLKGVYLANPKQDKVKTPKLMILVHGYTSRGILLRQYAEIFYSMGYDLFIPDARGHGMSDGDYIGFGWPDRIDLKNWILKMVNQFHGNVDIALWGVSMGGAEVMMTAGEKLPPQVKCIIEDCGYASTEEELTYQLKKMFHLPSFPVIPLASAYTEMRDGYNFYESSAVKQLKKNHLPMLFIHGMDDKFVPVQMVDEVYQATQGPKEKVLFPKAGHAKSFQSNPTKYRHVVSQFLQQYFN